MSGPLCRRHEHKARRLAPLAPRVSGGVKFGILVRDPPEETRNARIGSERADAGAEQCELGI